MDPFSSAVSITTVLQLTASIVRSCGTYIKKLKLARESIANLQREIESLEEVLEGLNELLGGQGKETLITFNKSADELKNCCMVLRALYNKINPDTTQAPIRRWGLRALKWPLKRAEVDGAIVQIERHKSWFSLALQIDQARYIDRIERKLDLEQLRIASGAAYDSYENKHAECLPGTRSELLHQIDEWAKSPHGKCIFWLNGMAGTGKSSISRTVAGHLNENKLLGASFFFKRGEEGRGNAKCLFPTIIRQLAISVPQLVPGIQRALRAYPNMSERKLVEQFEKLVIQSLRVTTHSSSTRMVIVIDGLDECEQEDDIRDIIQLLPRVNMSNSMQLRFLLTSRPELSIITGFNKISDHYQEFALHMIPQPVIEHDISMYFRTHLSQLRQDRSLLSDWPGDECIEILVKKAAPLFISAATLCRFIGDVNWVPPKRLEAILADQAIYVSKMDGTYLPVLRQLLIGQNLWETRELVQEFKTVVGVIILLASPLSITALGRLINKDPYDVMNRLARLHSVLHVPDNPEAPVRLLHLSFRDFLLDTKTKETKESERFWIDKSMTHQHLTKLSIGVMRRILRKNICDLPGGLPPELRYACRYWAHHLIRSQHPADELTEAFSFLEVHFIHWVETMSLMGFVPETVEIIKSLQSVTQGDEHSQIFQFLGHAKRFLLQSRHIAEAAPQQLYNLDFTFHIGHINTEGAAERKTLSLFCRQPKGRLVSETDMLNSEGHLHTVQSVAFSSNSQLLASGSSDNAIRLWNTTTGELRKTLDSHSNPVRSVAFSQNGQLLASGSEDNTVKLWNTTTGGLQSTLKGHSFWVRSVSFAPNGLILASSSEDNTVKLWDIDTCELRQTLKGHSSWVRSLVFSQNGQTLASGSGDKTIKLWDPVTGQLKQTLKGHSGWIQSVAFSATSPLLASGSCDNTIRLWDTNTYKVRQSLSGHFGSIQSVVFSPNGKLLASGSEDNTIRVWDTATWKLLQTLRGHSDWVQSVDFSQDSQTLASGSCDNTVKLWNIITGELKHTLQGGCVAA